MIQKFKDRISFLEELIDNISLYSMSGNGSLHLEWYAKGFNDAVEKIYSEVNEQIELYNKSEKEIDYERELVHSR